MHIADSERYKKQNYVNCGSSGLKISKFSFGMWHGFGDGSSYETMKSLVFTAFDHGINSFDLADIYGPVCGSAEINFGRILKEELGSYRNELVISSKAGYPMWNGPLGSGGSKKHMIAGVDDSLRRMNLDYVDIYYHHLMDPETPVEETAEALSQIVRQGKALYIGLSNYDGPTMEKFERIFQELHCPYVVNQNRYSLLDRTIENNGLIEKTAAYHKGLITFSPLAQGILTDKYLDGIPKDSRMCTDGRFLKPSVLTYKKRKMLIQLNEMAQQRGEKLATMALNWVVKHGSVTSVILGASRPEQIIANLKVLEAAEFTTEELKKMDELSESVKNESIFS